MVSLFQALGGGWSPEEQRSVSIETGFRSGRQMGQRGDQPRPGG